ncbi:MAG: hypothetical protein IKH58_09900 [Bacteroidales bacterium]|nr:hypothetical protein [Bacteroidales bacterium]
MFSINSNFSISRLNNAEITAFYINLQKAITTNDPTKLGVVGILPAFGSKLQELIDRVYVSQGSEFTAAMKAADDRRCLIFRRIRLRLQMVEVAEQNEALLAIQDVVRAHLLSKYVATVTSKAYQERTSILQGFILDLNEKLGDSGIATLGLAEDITALEDANNEFIAAYAQRTAEKAEGNMGVTLRLRDEMYDIYLQMIYTVQYLANSTDEANAEKATACQAFIAHVNVLLSDAKKRLEQRLSGGDTEGEGSNEGGDSSSATDSSDSTDSGGSGSGSGEGHTDTTEPTDNGGSNGGSSNGGTSNPSNPSNPSNSSNPSEGGNSSDPNQPSENGVVNGDEVSF